MYYLVEALLFFCLVVISTNVIFNIVLELTEIVLQKVLYCSDKLI